MKKIIFYCLFITISFVSPAQTKKTSFEKAVKDIVAALKKKNNTLIKKYIDPKTGFYLLHRTGVFDQYSRVDEVDLNSSGITEILMSYTGSTTMQLRYARLPSYNCDNDKWSKTGAFADTSGKQHQLSETAKNLVKYEVQEISKHEIKKLEEAEKGNWKVIVADTKGNSCIFYLVYKKNRWYLNIFDGVTTDCSA